MSTAVVSTSTAESRFFLLDDESLPEAISTSAHENVNSRPYSTIKNPQSIISVIGSRKSTVEKYITPASRLAICPAPEMAPSGIAALDALTSGLPRGCLTEICGPASSGRTTVLLAALAAATRRGEFCALIDASDTLDPHSAAASGVEIDRLLWVRCKDDSLPKKRSPRGHRVAESTKSKDSNRGCPISRALFAREMEISPQTALNFDETKYRSEHRLEQLLRAADMLVESGGFGMIVLDLAGLPVQAARRIPLTTWFRFRRAVEHKPTILLAIEQQPIAGSCSTLLLRLGVPCTQCPVQSSKHFHTQLLTELQMNAELTRSRLERRPARSVTFESKTAWAG